jgi:uncharacterized membrane protein
VSNNNRVKTLRVQTLSDGTFAIIITLLVLEMRRPNAGSGHLGYRHYLVPSVRRRSPEIGWR